MVTSFGKMPGRKQGGMASPGCQAGRKVAKFGEEGTGGQTQTVWKIERANWANKVECKLFGLFVRTAFFECTRCFVFTIHRRKPRAPLISKESAHAGLIGIACRR
jgi:hypothetical protein